MAQVAVYWSISVVRSRIIWVQHTTQLFSSFCQSKKWLLLIKWQGIWSAVKLLKAAKCSYCIKTHSGAKVSIMQWHSKTIRNHCHFLPLFTTFYHFLPLFANLLPLYVTFFNRRQFLKRCFGNTFPKIEREALQLLLQCFFLLWRHEPDQDWLLTRSNNSWLEFSTL